MKTSEKLVKTPREYRDDPKRCRELLERQIEPEV
jgi:hypothetical protein